MLDKEKLDRLENRINLELAVIREGQMQSVVLARSEVFDLIHAARELEDNKIELSSVYLKLQTTESKLAEKTAELERVREFKIVHKGSFKLGYLIPVTIDVPDYDPVNFTLGEAIDSAKEGGK